MSRFHIPETEVNSYNSSRKCSACRKSVFTMFRVREFMLQRKPCLAESAPQHSVEHDEQQRRAAKRYGWTKNDENNPPKVQTRMICIDCLMANENYRVWCPVLAEKWDKKKKIEMLDAEYASSPVRKVAAKLYAEALSVQREIVQREMDKLNVLRSFEIAKYRERVAGVQKKLLSDLCEAGLDDENLDWRKRHLPGEEPDERDAQ